MALISLKGLCWRYLSISGLTPTSVSTDTSPEGLRLELLCASERGTVVSFPASITCKQCQGRVKFTILGMGLIHSHTHTLGNHTQGGHIHTIVLVMFGREISLLLSRVRTLR